MTYTTGTFTSGTYTAPAVGGAATLVSDLVTLAQLKDFLHIPVSDVSNDVRLQEYIDAASTMVTYAVGPVVSEQHTEVHVPDGSRIVLDWVPVLAVLSVTEYVGRVSYTLTAQPPGQTVDNYGYSLDLPAAGLVVRRSGGGVECPFFGSPVVVSYTAGRSSVPPDILLAVLEDIRGLYQQTQQGGRPGFQSSQTSDTWTAGPMHLFPRLQALLESAARTQSIA